LGGIRSLSNLKTDSPFDRIIQGQIIEVLPEQGQVVVLFSDEAGRRVLPITHPFSSPDGFHRVIPERNSHVLVGFRASSANFARIIAYIEPDEKNRLDRRRSEFQDTPLTSQWTKPAEQSTFHPYRLLRESEQESRTRGDAAWFMSNRGRISLHGGPNTLWLDKDELEVGVRTPVLKHHIINHRYSGMEDVQQTGVVERPKPEQDQEHIVKIYPRTDKKFLRERYLKLRWKGKPEVVVHEQTGHCVLVCEDLPDDSFYDDDKLDRPWVKYFDYQERTRHFVTYWTDGGKKDDKGGGEQEGQFEKFGWQYGVFGDVHFYLPKHKDHQHGWHIDIPDEENGNMRRYIGVDDYGEIGRDLTDIVARDEKIEVGAYSSHMVGKDRTTLIGENRFDAVVKLWTQECEEYVFGCKTATFLADSFLFQAPDPADRLKPLKPTQIVIKGDVLVDGSISCTQT